nr:hypothetical protein WG33_0269 [uncultured bacterium]
MGTAGGPSAGRGYGNRRRAAYCQHHGAAALGTDRHAGPGPGRRTRHAVGHQPDAPAAPAQDGAGLGGAQGHAPRSRPALFVGGRTGGRAAAFPRGAAAGGGAAQPALRAGQVHRSQPPGRRRLRRGRRRTGRRARPVALRPAAGARTARHCRTAQRRTRAGGGLPAVHARRRGYRGHGRRPGQRPARTARQGGPGTRAGARSAAGPHQPGRSGAQPGGPQHPRQRGNGDRTRFRRPAGTGRGPARIGGRSARSPGPGRRRRSRLHPRRRLPRTGARPGPSRHFAGTYAAGGRDAVRRQGQGSECADGAGDAAVRHVAAKQRPAPGDRTADERNRRCTGRPRRRTRAAAGAVHARRGSTRRIRSRSAGHPQQPGHHPGPHRRTADGACRDGAALSAEPRHVRSGARGHAVLDDQPGRDAGDDG